MTNVSPALPLKVRASVPGSLKIRSSHLFSLDPDLSNGHVTSVFLTAGSEHGHHGSGRNGAADGAKNLPPAQGDRDGVEAQLQPRRLSPANLYRDGPVLELQQELFQTREHDTEILLFWRCLFLSRFPEVYCSRCSD